MTILCHVFLFYNSDDSNKKCCVLLILLIKEKCYEKGKEKVV